jgi:hypothetical protein
LLLPEGLLNHCFNRPILVQLAIGILGREAEELGVIVLDFYLFIFQLLSCMLKLLPTIFELLLELAELLLTGF